MTDPSSFWARRRAAVQAEAEADLQAVEAARIDAVHADLAEKDDETILEEMGLPDPDKLTAGDDFAAFMVKEVPDHLRNRALRKLWRSNPVLACVDGLNEYDDDYRAAMLAGGPIKTAYQVGKGMMAHLEEMARKEQEESCDVATQEVDSQPEPDQPEEDRPEAEAVVEVQPAFAPDAPSEESPAPRRMRFHFEEASV